MIVNFSGNLLNFNTPKIMGIVNVTPDSFYDGGRLNSKNKILKYVEYLIKNEVDIIDIGGCSTRPGSKIVKEKEERNRVIPPIKYIIKEFSKIKISIDTFRSKIAEEGIEEGAVMINDISGGELDKNMFPLLKKLHQIPYILGHMGNLYPSNFNKSSKNNLIIKINKFFAKKILYLKKCKINDIIIDPGFGFGKTIEQNFQLLKNLSLIGFKDHLILIGISRKSMIKNFLNLPSYRDSLNATSSIHTIALLNGIKFIRVHDVKEAKECIKIVKHYQEIF